MKMKFRGDNRGVRGRIQDEPDSRSCSLRQRSKEEAEKEEAVAVVVTRIQEYFKNDNRQTTTTSDESSDAKKWNISDRQRNRLRCLEEKFSRIQSNYNKTTNSFIKRKRSLRPKLYV